MRAYQERSGSGRRGKDGCGGMQEGSSRTPTRKCAVLDVEATARQVGEADGDTSGRVAGPRAGRSQDRPVRAGGSDHLGLKVLGSDGRGHNERPRHWQVRVQFGSKFLNRDTASHRSAPVATAQMKEITPCPSRKIRPLSEAPINLNTASCMIVRACSVPLAGPGSGLPVSPGRGPPMTTAGS